MHQVLNRKKYYTVIRSFHTHAYITYWNDIRGSAIQLQSSGANVLRILDVTATILAELHLQHVIRFIHLN